MAPVNASIQAGASLGMDVRPARSQVVLVALVIAACISLGLGAWLCYVDKPVGWAFWLLSAGLFISVIWSWSKAHRDIDLERSRPTQVILPDGVSISTDSRLLASGEGSKNLGALINAMIERQPLPEPEGRVAQDGKVIPNSKVEAIEQVKQINEEVQALSVQAATQMRDMLQGPSTIQPKAEVIEMPQIPETGAAPVPLVGP